MGSHSGKNGNKVKEAGLNPIELENTVGFEEAEMIFVCKKIYQQRLVEEGFIEKSIVKENFPEKDFHETYVGEILKILVRDDRQ